MYLQLYTTHIDTWLWYYQSMNLWIYGCTSTSTFCIYSWTMHRLCSLCTLTCWILCLDFIRKFKDCQWLSERLSERLSVFSTLFTSVDFFQIPHTHWVRIFMVPLICISSRSRMQTFIASSLSSNATSGLILFQSDAGFRVTDCIRVATFTQGPTRLQLIFFPGDVRSEIFWLLPVLPLPGLWTLGAWSAVQKADGGSRCRLRAPEKNFTSHQTAERNNARPTDESLHKQDSGIRCRT